MHPELIRGWPIHSYGLMLVVGFYAAYFLSRWTAKREGVDPNHMINILLIGAVLGIVGARLFYVVQFSEQVEGLADLIAFWKGGLVFYGGLIVATVGLILYIRWKKLPVWRVADAAAPAIMLGVMFGRIGCFVNGCCWGDRCDADFALAVRFPKFVAEAGAGGCAPVPPVAAKVAPDGQWHPVDVRGAPRPITTREQLARYVEREPDAWRHLSVTWARALPQPDGTLKEERIVGSYAFLQHLVRYPKEIGPDDDRSLAVHPTQLYAAFEGLVICAALLIWRRWRRRPGEVFALMLALYAVGRFVLENYRTDTEPILAGLTMGQVISVPLLVGAVIAVVRCRRRGRDA